MRAKPVQREHYEQAALFAWMWANRAKHPALEMAFAIPNGGARHIAVARKLKSEGVKSGVPDIFLPWPVSGSQWPNSTGFSGMFIEMKSKSGTVSPNQKEWFRMLGNVGYKVELCFGWQEAAKTICDYLGLDAEKLGVA